MTVTFCGHSDVYEIEAVRNWLKIVIRQMIGQGATEFYSGGYGDFDRLVAGVLREMQGEFPQIQSILVLAYLEKQCDMSRYDDCVYPEIEGVPKRFAISKRNESMVLDCDVMVAYVTHDWGGAAKMLEYARRKGRRVVLYPDIGG